MIFINFLTLLLSAGFCCSSAHLAIAVLSSFSVYFEISNLLWTRKLYNELVRAMYLVRINIVECGLETPSWRCWTLKCALEAVFM